MPPNTVPALLEEYSGGGWSVVSGFPVGDTLSAISCTTAGACYAVGEDLVEIISSS